MVYEKSAAIAAKPHLCTFIMFDEVESVLSRPGFQLKNTEMPNFSCQLWAPSGDFVRS